MTDRATNDHLTLPVPNSLRIDDADIYLIGFGLRIPNDLTLEAIAALNRCQRVFGVPPIDLTSIGLPRVEDLTYLYGGDKKRGETYEEITSSVIQAAKESPPVALVTYGSAMVGAYPCHRLLEDAPEHGLRISVCNGVSFLEGIWADLNIDPFFGFLVWEANHFVAVEATPPVDAHLLIVQAPFFAVDTGPHLSEMGLTMDLGDLSPLQRHLLNFYPADHQVSFVRTVTFHEPASVRSCRLDEMAEAAKSDLSSLLVPRLVRG